MMICVIFGILLHPVKSFSWKKQQVLLLPKVQTNENTTGNRREYFNLRNTEILDSACVSLSYPHAECRTFHLQLVAH